MLKIKPGECGSWPRASVRMVDLPDGPHSDGGTLELAGPSGLPSARPNLDGDPNTDELIELLGGGARRLREQVAGAAALSREPAATCGARATFAPGDYRELAADAAPRAAGRRPHAAGPGGAA